MQDQDYTYEYLNKEEHLKKTIEVFEKDFFQDCLTERWINTLPNPDLNQLGKIQSKLKGQKDLLNYLKELYAKKDY